MAPTFDAGTTGEEVASHYRTDIAGKTILVTGVSTGGLGLETAKILGAHSPAQLILAARSSPALNSAAEEIRATAPNVPVKLLTLDLSSISKVRAAAAELNSWADVPKIDILINNAGMQRQDYGVSEDGIENHFAVNHIGPWLFTNLIMGKVVQAKGRVIFVSSMAHLYSGVRFDDWNFEDGKAFTNDLAYGQSKTANILTARYIAHRLGKQGVTAYSLHPGFAITNMQRKIPREVLQAKGFYDKDGNVAVPLKTLSQASATMIFVALDPDLVESSGEYLADCRVEEGQLVSEAAKDLVGAQKMWELSEKLIGEKFVY